MADFAGEEIDLFDVYDGFTAEQLIESGLDSAQINVAGVAQYALNSVDVGFTTAPNMFDRYATGDALNPGSYVIDSDDCSPPMISLVECVGPGVVRLYFDANLDHGCTYKITVVGVTSAYGETLGVSFGSFTAFAEGATSISGAKQGQGRTDLLNVPGAEIGNGGMQYDQSGDVANHSGLSYLRKRILRRVTTVFGGFFHLPNYGSGQRLKTNTSRAQMTRLEKKIKTQCENEPDVQTVKVRVQLRHPSVFHVVITVLSADGESLRVTETFDLAGV